MNISLNHLWVQRYKLYLFFSFKINTFQAFNNSSRKFHRDHQIDFFFNNALESVYDVRKLVLLFNVMLKLAMNSILSGSNIELFNWRFYLGMRFTESPFLVDEKSVNSSENFQNQTWNLWNRNAQKQSNIASYVAN